MTACLTAAKEISLKAAVAAVVSQVEGVFHIKTITNKVVFFWLATCCRMVNIASRGFSNFTKLTVKTLSGPVECDKLKVRPITLQVLPSLSKCFLWALD